MVLDETIMIQDGALGEETGIPARRYAEKFPKEFFNYIDSDTTNSRYSKWVGSIEYSGFYKGDNYEKPQEVEVNMRNTMKSNCENCSEEILKRIKIFAKECFD